MSLTTKTKRTRKSADKRVAGRHHKRNDHYLKTYWPYLPLVLMVAVGILANSLLGMRHSGVLGYATDVSPSVLLSETNNQRTSNSLGSLALNSVLNQAAQAKANDMAARDYWSHNTPDGNTPWTFFTAAGYQYKTAGENLAYGFDTSATTVTAWMNSPGHRANILNNTYKEVGFGIANSANYQGTGPETIVVAMYASPAAVAAAPAPTPAPAAPAKSTPAPTTAEPAAEQAAPASDTPEAKTPETNQTASPAGSPADGSKPSTEALEAANNNQSITRVQLLASSKAAPWSVFAVSTIATVALAIFLLRHGLVWHRVLVKGEKFILKHRMLDMVLVGAAVLGVILTRTVGVIR
ncbi:MAG TPA: CAP domain-containing protein [Candidatus Saccharimonadales bacterium]|nr:CAP domain-containing protein [Candidatus Saccharimonadales bacterium]